MKIGELARTARCTVETVRYYEKEGLLPCPERTIANYRSYGPLHVERLRFIRNCRSLDMSHDEIRALLALKQQPDATCVGVNQILDTHIAHVTDRISELCHLQEELLELRGRCQEELNIGACKILHGLTTRKAEKSQGKPGHLC